MDFNIGRSSGPRKTAKAAPRTGGALAGWLMTAVAPFGENEEHAMDQALVELGLGDARLIRGEGAMLPMGFEPGVPQDLPMGTLVECHLSKATVHSSGIASAGVAWALCTTPEGDECAIVSTMSHQGSMEECEVELRRNLQRKLGNRDLELSKDDDKLKGKVSRRHQQPGTRNVCKRRGYPAPAPASSRSGVPLR